MVKKFHPTVYSLPWRHNGRDGVSNNQPHHCLLNRLFRRRSKKTSKLRVTGLCARNSPVTGEFPAQMASNAENVSIGWRHRVTLFLYKCIQGAMVEISFALLSNNVYNLIIIERLHPRLFDYVPMVAHGGLNSTVSDHSLKRKCHFDEVFVIGCDFIKFRQNDDIYMTNFATYIRVIFIVLTTLSIELVNIHSTTLLWLVEFLVRIYWL